MSQLSQFTKLPSAHSSQKPCRKCPNLQNSHLPTHYRNHVANVPTYKCFTPTSPLITETMSQLSQPTNVLLPSAQSPQKLCRKCPNSQNSHLPTHHRNYVTIVPICKTPTSPYSVKMVLPPGPALEPSPAAQPFFH